VARRQREEGGRKDPKYTLFHSRNSLEIPLGELLDGAVVE
jgi:hypothetical protein